MKAPSFLRLPSLHDKGGYILIELILSLLVAFTLIAVLSRGCSQIFPTWHRLTNKTNLYDVGHYMLEILEKNISYDARLVTITKDNRNVDKLVCQTVKGSLTYAFTCEKQYIYKTIYKAKSTGTNPLYVSSCKVTDWRLTKLNDKQLLVEIRLKQDGTECHLQRVLSCLNGTVQTNAS